MRYCTDYKNGKCTRTKCNFPHLTNAEIAQEKKRLREEGGAADSTAAVATAKPKAKPKANPKSPASPCALSSGMPIQAKIGLDADSGDNSKVTFCEKIDVSEISIGDECKMRQYARRLPRERRTKMKVPSRLPFAFCCAINRARRMANELFENKYGDVIFWQKDRTMLFDSHMEMLDIEDDYWTTSWGLMSCWNAADEIEREMAGSGYFLNIADYQQTVPDEFVYSAPAVPGVLKKCHSSVDNFSVSHKWLVDTGCAHDRIPDSKAADYPKCLPQETPQEFSTANGETASTVRMNIKIPAIECKTSACLLPDTPAVLTVGEKSRVRVLIRLDCGQKALLDFYPQARLCHFQYSKTFPTCVKVDLTQIRMWT